MSQHLALSLSLSQKVFFFCSFFFYIDIFKHSPRCPKCGRVFDVYDSCLKHATARGHSLWCEPLNDSSSATSYSSTYLRLPPPPQSQSRVVGTSRNTLPRCLSSHSLLPQDELSGWCDVKGRRTYLEDHGAVVYSNDYIIWSVFDGHVKASAAQFAAHFLPSAMARRLDLDNPTELQVLHASYFNMFTLVTLILVSSLLSTQVLINIYKHTHTPFF
jgi:hypothetical protein